MILIVKSSLAFYIGTCLLLSGLLSGCGQTGALYLPKIPGKPTTPASTVTPSTTDPTSPANTPGVEPAYKPLQSIPPATTK